MNFLYGCDFIEFNDHFRLLVINHDLMSVCSDFVFCFRTEITLSHTHWMCECVCACKYQAIADGALVLCAIIKIYYYHFMDINVRAQCAFTVTKQLAAAVMLFACCFCYCYCHCCCFHCCCWMIGPQTHFPRRVFNVYRRTSSVCDARVCAIQWALNSGATEHTLTHMTTINCMREKQKQNKMNLAQFSILKWKP